MTERIVALAGNPNVGKSTIFNALTGMNQHTGNWPGKTVAKAEGVYSFQDVDYRLVDLPGTYSLCAHSTEEQIAREFICHGGAGVVIVICDATCLERNLNLVLQVKEIAARVVVCVNLMDEAAKKKIEIDIDKLSDLLEVPVIGTEARNKKGIDKLKRAVCDVFSEPPHQLQMTGSILINEEEKVEKMIAKGERIASETVLYPAEDVRRTERKIDRVLTGKYTGLPIMLLLLCLIFWITLYGANIPSEKLSTWLFVLEDKGAGFLLLAGIEPWIVDMVMHGAYRVLAWVVSVMLPPMAIFFPLFTILEDLGYLPRVAFNLDHYFKKACTCGKQALTMCMGFGCNAVGVTGCRIIDSPREQLIAMLTNNFVPCNGRFPTLIAIITMFFVGVGGGLKHSVLSALLLTGLVALGIALTFVSSRLLSKTVLKGIPSSFTLELPPYRRPQVGKVIVRSVFDRTLFVLGRAVCVAVPAGIMIWLLANISVGGGNLLTVMAGVLNPVGRALGMDGVILLAFILGFPANEIVVPIMIMIYMASGSLLDLDMVSLHVLLKGQGWTWVTALCTLVFCLLHWPCSTTCLTIKKESGSFKWTLLAAVLPTAFGAVICFLIASAARIFGAM